MEEEDNNKDLIKQRLTCSVLKKSYLDDQTTLLGYPIVRTNSRFNPRKIELYPIPEMLSYEGFLSEMENQQNKLDQYFETNFQLGNNFYNCWMPVYLNKDHYEKNRTHVLNSFSVIKFGPEGKKEFDFKPEQIFEILPIVLNKMIIGMFNGKSEISSAFIISYFQYVLLYKKLCEEFEEENMAFINKKLSMIFENEYKIDKKIIPDIGDFLMALFYCNKDTHEENMKKMWNCIFEEFIIRQMFWIFHSDEFRDKMRTMLLKDKNNEACLNKLKNERNFQIRFYDKFIDDLNRLKLFDQIVDIISKDEKYLDSLITGRDNAKEQAINAMNKNFKRLFSLCSEEGQKNIKKIIFDNLNFADYFEYEDDELYNDLKIGEILKDDILTNKDEIVKEAFDSQRGNKLLIITFFAQKKIEEKGFLEQLEKNYGVYLEVDDFIKDMNKKLEEIKTYKQLLEYVGCDYAQDKTDIDIMAEAYDKAKEKDYINTTNARPKRNIHPRVRPLNFRGSFGRGRGGFNNRGRGRGRGGFNDRGRGRGRGNNFRGRRYNNNRSRSRSRSDSH